MVKRKDNDKSQGIKSKAMKKVDDKSKKKKTITKKKSSKKNYS